MGHGHFLVVSFLIHSHAFSLSLHSGRGWGALWSVCYKTTNAIHEGFALVTEVLTKRSIS